MVFKTQSITKNNLNANLYLFVSQMEFTQVKQQVSSSFETNYTDNSSYPDDWLKHYFLMQSWKSIYPHK